MENYRIIVENSITGERYPVLSGNGRGDILIALSALVAAAKGSPHLKYFMAEDMYVKRWYAEAYPTDDMVDEINGEATLTGLMGAIDAKECVYEYIGACDSLIRERCFEKLAEIYGLEYSDVYNKWMSK